MAERSLRIQAFRNIGFKDEKPWYERIVLSNSLKKGELGGLRIVIGANNSGKSNVIRALNVFSDEELSERDVTDLFVEQNCKIPQITLFARDDGDEEDRYAYTKTLEEEDSITTPKPMDEEYSFSYLTKENFLDELNVISDAENDYLQYYCDKLLDLYNEDHDEEESIDDVFKETSIKMLSILTSYKNAYGSTREWEKFRRAISRTHAYKEFEAYLNFKSSNDEIKDKVNYIYKKEFGYNFIPKILAYTEEFISNDDLNSDYESIEESQFFLALFHSIDVNIADLQKVRDEYRIRHNMGILSKKSKELTKKLEDVSKKFNQLYYLESESYSFEIQLQEEKIHFYLYKGETPILIDYQSTGFRWFFNLFFNLLNSTDLNPGDIITMDEPATNLHVKGQRELRGFLKDFAIQNDITIIVVTHSPFLIDMDNLDEVRIVINENGISRIENNFSAVFKGDPDSLRPIKESLTVENRILVDPDEKVIFVEGITDYNYLTAFKKLLGKKGFTFLPINGVGGNESECKTTSSELLRIRKHNPILLVDNDNAGRQMKSVNDDHSALKVISLGEIDQKFKSIESLFTDDDLKKFGLDEKHASTSSIFKNHVAKSELSADTLSNFGKLFSHLEQHTT